jgi:uncharacterized protein (DUF305 family)
VLLPNKYRKSAQSKSGDEAATGVRMSQSALGGDVSSRHLSRVMYARFAVRLAVFVSVAAVACARPSARTDVPPYIGMMGDSAAKLRAVADSLKYPYTEADIRFMTGMIHHHAQAIRMASWAASHGASPAVVRLTERIVNAQADEIKFMQLWLRDRRQPVPEPNPEGMIMNMGGMQHTMLMPGMLTAEQMRELDAARGSDFDRLFLTFMIQHHRGAVGMVKELFSAHGAGQDESVFKFANDVEVDQTTEINRMLQMLLGLR